MTPTGNRRSEEDLTPEDEDDDDDPGAEAEDEPTTLRKAALPTRWRSMLHVDSRRDLSFSMFFLFSSWNVKECQRRSNNVEEH